MMRLAWGWTLRVLSTSRSLPCHTRLRADHPSLPIQEKLPVALQRLTTLINHPPPGPTRRLWLLKHPRVKPTQLSLFDLPHQGAGRPSIAANPRTVTGGIAASYCSHQPCHLLVRPEDYGSWNTQELNQPTSCYCSHQPCHLLIRPEDYGSWNTQELNQTNSRSLPCHTRLRPDHPSLPIQEKLPVASQRLTALINPATS
ncbi:hypothetical protein J6590_074887 [Homalodisca vitripennis]|nr:hypothetical protein J6590_074887 [Homalodisca vitripennis]